MMSLTEWFLLNNNWVFPLVASAIWALFCLVHANTNWGRLRYAVVGAILGFTLFGGMTAVDGYGSYKRHYTTCTKPEAVAAFYIFDAKKERCMRPFVGFIQVGSSNVIEVKPQPKPIVTKGDNYV